jgi:bis(5'-nucleosidyl)-tetraphosphatase
MGEQVAKKTERACGCIPFMRDRDRRIVSLMILRTGGYWEFPKGKQEEGEKDEETALRELKEETGLTGELAPEPPITTSYDFERDGVHIHKEVVFYFCKVPDGSSVTIQKSEVNDYAWLPLEDLMDRATYPQIKDIARKACMILAD